MSEAMIWTEGIFPCNNLSVERMSANHAEDIVIPSVFIGQDNGVLIIENYIYPLNYALIITDDVPFNINNNLIIPFAIVVGLSFIIMICFLIIRCIREHRRSLRHRLPNKILKKIPIVKFAKGMQYDTCAICLDDYIENERLRVLPCHHAYHMKCIDPWLTKNRRVCPICKRTVVARGERRPRIPRSSTDSLSSSDADENTPLLNPAEITSVSVAPSVAATSQNNGNAATHASQSANDDHVVNVNGTDDDNDDELLDDNNVQSMTNFKIRMLLTRSHLIDALRRDGTLPATTAQRNSSNESSTNEGGGESSFSPIGEETRPTGTWNQFMRQLRSLGGRQREQQLLSDDDVEPATEGPNGSSSDSSSSSSRMAISATAASNNILNSNLSGSFHGDDTTDDEIVGANRRDNNVKRSQKRPAPSSDLPSTSGTNGSGSNEVARLGVAALPNVNFNPNQPTRGSNRRGASRSGNESGNNYPV
ncbi:E3 ubiquitin-protein ligase Godzilla isoform X2 [Toxorhynchites rutilus septentrionalis]|uniref:E3 ubiquitin-protein ligase Godzilla isoform X2 n=1 Tax=Toxorhynchites rutilus septentrionalis TaxID=329112 RepID=UPI0024789FD2|nr:E3 ubiquitin-protein ligase Godzilla isoform X2 [Toxorhynchites rutilus septentrionalis]